MGSEENDRKWKLTYMCHASAGPKLSLTDTSRVAMTIMAIRRHTGGERTHGNFHQEKNGRSQKCKSKGRVRED